MTSVGRPIMYDSTYWGASIGFDLCRMPAYMGDCLNWMPAEYCGWAEYSLHTVSECGIDVGSISFTVGGQMPRTELRLQFVEQGRIEHTYLTVPAGKFVGNPLEATVAHYPGAPPINLANLEAIRFWVAADEAGPVEFDFCIADLQITGPGATGGTGEADGTGGAGGAPVCLLGEVEYCYGTGNCLGTKACVPNGSGYTPCDCTNPGIGGSAGTTDCEGNETAALGTDPLVDDLEDGDGAIPEVDGRTGGWYTYNDATPGAIQEPTGEFVPISRRLRLQLLGVDRRPGFR